MKDILWGLMLNVKIKSKHRRKVVLAAYRESLRAQEYAFTTRIWHSFEILLTDHEMVIEVANETVSAFAKSPGQMDVKVFLLIRILHELSYAQVDQILCSMEDRFGEAQEDSSNSFLLCNLNAIQTACHFLYLLDKIQKRYSMAHLRT